MVTRIRGLRLELPGVRHILRLRRGIAFWGENSCKFNVSSKILKHFKKIIIQNDYFFVKLVFENIFGNISILKIILDFELLL